MKPPNWTSEDDARMISLLDGKRPAAEIAAAIGSTKNSVIGRLRRMRQSGKLPADAKVRPPSSKIAKKPEPLRASKRIYQERRMQAIKANWRTRPTGTIDPSGLALHVRFAEGYMGQTGRLAFDEIRFGTCKFPIDQPAGPMRLCGLEAERGGSWCAHHAARVFTVKSKGGSNDPSH